MSWNSDYEERKKQIEEDDKKATELYNDGMYLYNIAHFDEAKGRFRWALDYAHDNDLIVDCREMIDRCDECLFEVGMR